MTGAFSYIVFGVDESWGVPQALELNAAPLARNVCAMSSLNQQSLHGYALGEIPWFIDVAAQFNG
jgi:hypothetical protein